MVTFGTPVSDQKKLKPVENRSDREIAGDLRIASTLPIE